MKISGRITEWKVAQDEFMVGTPCGDYRIIAEGCSQTFRDMLVDAMKGRKMVRIEIEEGTE